MPAIVAVSRDREIPLSFAQQRLWFLDQLEPNSAFYNIPAAIRLNGQLNVSALQQSINEVIKRHEILRTTFVNEYGYAVQKIALELKLSLVEIDLSHLNKNEQELKVLSLINEEVGLPFQLSQLPLLRVKLIRLAAAECVLVLVMHHIISDGWSIAIFVSEVAEYYQAHSEARAVSIAPLEIQYADYTFWQWQWIQGEGLAKQLSYWREQLADMQPLQLPTDYNRPPIQSYRGERQRIRLSNSLKEALNELSRRSGTTLFMTLLAAFNTLLYRYSGQRDIVVGTDIANRNRAEIERLIGFFVNQLVLRTAVDGQITFNELLMRVRETALAAYTHQDLPFDKLVEELNPARDLSRSPLFQAKFILQNTPQSMPSLGTISLTPIEFSSNVAKFDITLSMVESVYGLIGMVEYSTALFDSITISRMMAHLQNLLSVVVANPQQHISDLQMLSETEKHQLLVEWNDTAVDYPQDKCIHQLFEEQVERTPDAIAVVYEQEQVTYQQLNRRANQLAHYLRREGVRPEVLVGICLERCIDMVVSILAVLKAGGAYLPLDPHYPTERIAFIMEDAGIFRLITTERLIASFPAAADFICLDSDWKRMDLEEITNPVKTAVADNLAYTIYTSGSTGKPKGVQILHR
ncbi:MAG: condensation domain-containing protein, partial [Acidobacteriota bacterium]